MPLMKNRYTRSVDPIVYVAVSAVCVHGLAIAHNNVIYPPFPLLWLTGLWTAFTLALAIGHLCRSLRTNTGSPRQRKICLVMLALLLLPVMIFSFSPGRLFCWPLANLAFRASGDCAKLQAWAGKITTKEAQRASVSLAVMRRLQRAEVPDFVSKMVPGAPIVEVWLNSPRGSQFDGGNPETAFVALAWGRGGEGHGILVGPPSFRIRSTSHWQVYPISDGVYRFEER